MANYFPYLPTPDILQWLAGGQLANRFHRALRSWVILSKLYNNELNFQTFTYIELRDKLFSELHPKSDISAKLIQKQCHDKFCICHKTFADIALVPENQQHVLQWCEEITCLTGISGADLQKYLKQYPFATVHRSLRDDLKYLSQLGWLQITNKGEYKSIAKEDLPSPPKQTHQESLPTQLSISQTWELLRALEPVAFIQPNLSLIINSLWEQIANTSTSLHLEQEPQQRIFLHLDYILSQQMQDSVDNYQEQIEQLWRRPPGGVIQFNYWIAAEERKVKITVYPICLHYLRRAKYLSAYGIDPDSNFGWHNYRLDRIASKILTVLPWGDPRVPKELKELWHTGSLPTPEMVQKELDAAWGFNFYLKKELLILRFKPAFAKWYVDNTARHPTFHQVEYSELPNLINKKVPKQEQQQLLKILQNRDKNDAYYTAWIRTGDINVLMRLRDWRPNGEVIAPLSIRIRMKEEANQESKNYEI